MQNRIFKKGFIFGIIVLFIGVSFAPYISVISEEIDEKETINLIDNVDTEEETTVTFYTFDKTGTMKSEKVLSPTDLDEFCSKFEELKNMIKNRPFDDETQMFKVEFVDLLDGKNLIPDGLSKHDIISLLNPSWVEKLKDKKIGFNLPSFLPLLGSRASSFICSVTSGGAGVILPFFLLPRPRIITIWNSNALYEIAVTAVGSLLFNRGFVAAGRQTGVALGFAGIGMSYGTPVGPIYGLTGYAMFTMVTADYIERYPPNNPPAISSVNPPNGAQNIPISLSELSFGISDDDGDRMSYVVTTEPYIGGGSDNNLKDGFYSIPVSGLEPETLYKWTIRVSDGKDTTEKTFSFTTETLAPIVSNPLPPDGAKYVSVDLSQLSFHLKDYQGDAMDYTVETYPDIGSDSATGVGDGTYTVDVSGLDHSTEYKWYVNATDGTHWKHEVFSFQTELKMVFDPFEEGWLYRKNITIDNSKVSGDLSDFPVLISTVDSDLRDKAQNDGDDIIFMDGDGVANRLYHEIKYYDGSSGELVAWMNVPTLISGEDTILYMYYGNPVCGDQQIPESVWDSDYLMVQHLDETSGNHYDSTSNSNDGIPRGGVAQGVTGKIVWADKFDGVDDYMEIIDASDFKFVNEDLSFSTWVQIVDNTDEYRVFICLSGNDDAYPSITLAKARSGISGGRIYMQVYSSQQGVLSMATSILNGDSLPKNEWLYLTGVVDYPDSLKLYLNAELQESVTLVNFDMSEANNLNLHIGETAYPGYKWGRHNGLIDEVRISKTARNAEWISTSYNNQNDPTNFLSFGSEETGP